MTTERRAIDITGAECATIAAAFEVFLREQLPEECKADGTPKRLRTVRKLAGRFDQDARGLTFRYELTRDEAHEVSEALDSYLYWEVSDPQDRCDGFVYFENTGNGKMDRNDRDPDYVEECRDLQLLGGRFASLHDEGADS